MKDNFYHNKRLMPDDATSEQLKKLETVDGMREALKAHAMHSPLVRRVFDIARYQGMSEEDTMVFLAFHAVCHGERMGDMYQQRMQRETVPYMLVRGEWVK